ncbi:MULTISPECIES: hypothetical protein [Rhizobium]|uniref:Uncharacterized protein n=1 Tax=Rhizobium rhizoryzae TaxID=451876 RepID=A0A7W6LE18_9HYPH|nr:MULTISPECIES: hypothetical protein [Rhizobium]MBB4142521.1 hypothetical protein [Rhizobium rhizoryzae]
MITLFAAKAANEGAPPCCMETKGGLPKQARIAMAIAIGEASRENMAVKCRLPLRVSRNSHNAIAAGLLSLTGRKT